MLGKLCAAILLCTIPNIACGRLGYEDKAPEPGNALPVVVALEIRDIESGQVTNVYSAGQLMQIEARLTAEQGFGGKPAQLFVTTDGSSWTAIATDFAPPMNRPREFAFTQNYPAPSDDFFRLKVVAKDSAGKTSIPAWSDAFNAGSWSVYAGSPDTGIGGTAHSVALKNPVDTLRPFAIDPNTNDIYAADRLSGVVRLDAETNKTSMFVQTEGGADNFVDDGAIPPTLVSSFNRIPFFDNAGRLYLMTRRGRDQRTIVHQLDLGANTMRLYVAESEAAISSSMAFDEQNNLYFLASCTPDTWTDSSTVRLMRLSQNTDGSPGTTTHLAGNCVKGLPAQDGPVDALSAPITQTLWPTGSSLSAWNNGEIIYFSTWGEPAIKILDGQIMATDIFCESGSLSYVSTTNMLYCANDGITRYSPNLSGPGGEVGEQWLASTGDRGCSDDGEPIASACVDAFEHITVNRDGTFVFTDGGVPNTLRNYRIRAIDADERLTTLMGSLPFWGAGRHANLMRGTFSGIYYKRDDEPNQNAFPSGLYFVERDGPVFGYVDPTTQIVSNLWGTQVFDGTIGGPGELPSGSSIGSQVPYGTSRTTNAFPLTFDANGLPWLEYNHHLVRISGDHKLEKLQEGTSPWETSQDGDDPRDYRCYTYGLFQNLTLKEQGVFFLGGLSTSSSRKISYFDFGASRITDIMGGDLGGSSPDTATPGTVRNLTLHNLCHNQRGCYVDYHSSTDRLYFGETNKVRYISDPTDPSQSTLTTLFTASETVHNFIFSLDRQQLYYVAGGQLRCHAIGGDSPSWCDDTALGPPTGLATIGDGPNQLTWMDSNRLLVSTTKGEIYQYTLLP